MLRKELIVFQNCNLCFKNTEYLYNWQVIPKKIFFKIKSPAFKVCLFFDMTPFMFFISMGSS